MYTLAKSMALFWTLSEWLILLAVRWGLDHLEGRNTAPKEYLAVFFLITAISTCLIFFGESLAEQIAGFSSGTERVFLRWAVWDFFCTAWVLLEGIIMVYVSRIFRLLHHIEQNGIKNDRMRLSGNKQWIIILLIATGLAAFILYEGMVFTMVVDHTVGNRGIVRLSLFYVRICGLFWICFEWIVAYFGIRTYFLLKHGGSRDS